MFNDADVDVDGSAGGCRIPVCPPLLLFLLLCSLSFTDSSREKCRSQRVMCCATSASASAPTRTHRSVSPFSLYRECDLSLCRLSSTSALLLLPLIVICCSLYSGSFTIIISNSSTFTEFLKCTKVRCLFSLSHFAHLPF